MGEAPEALEHGIANDHRLVVIGSAVDNAVAERWSGTLTVTTTQGGQVFEGEAGGVFKLLTALDRQYRDWLAAQAAPAEGGGGEAGGP